MSKYFVISIGNNGSILTLYKNKVIYKNIFIDDITDGQKTDEVTKIFKQFSRSDIYIVLDNVGQNYIKKTFNNINYFDLLKVVDRRFNYEIPKGDLKEKRFLGKNKVTKDWEYMFISSPIDDFLQNWLNIIETQNNILKGIFMLPLECENILEFLIKKNGVNLKNANSKNNNKKNLANRWAIILFENKISGLRETTFCNGKLLFTRILSLDTDYKNFLRSFEENKYRTIEYLKRFSQEFDENQLDIFVIVSSDKKDILSKTADKRIKVYSSREFCLLNNENKIAKYQEDYCDIVLQKLIIKNKKIISFSNKEMNLTRRFSLTLKILNVTKVIIFLLLLIFFFSFVIITSKLKRDFIDITKVYNDELKILENKKKSKFGKDMKDVDLIIDIGSFYSELENNNSDPFEFIKKFSKAVYGTLLVNDIKWKKLDYTKNTNFNLKHKSLFNVSGLLINKSGKIDDLFKIYDSFTKSLNDAFTDYTIKVSDLPKNVNFNTNYFEFLLKIDFFEK